MNNKKTSYTGSLFLVLMVSVIVECLRCYLHIEPYSAIDKSCIGLGLVANLAFHAWGYPESSYYKTGISASYNQTTLPLFAKYLSKALVQITPAVVHALSVFKDFLGALIPSMKIQ